MKISKETAKKEYLSALEKNICSGEKAVIFYSKELLNYRLNLLQNTFPKNTLHAIAIKTCNQINVLTHIVKQGFGLEAASMEEVLLAKAAGIKNENIVFDSPVKTRAEINKCHHELQGILLNANSLEELDRYPKNFSGKIGLRINPLVENSGGTYFNVATKNSKFGVPISKRREIIEKCIQHTSISCLHFHIGSNLTDLSPNIKAIALITELATEINDLRQEKGITTKIDTLDIGGGIEFNKETIEDFVYEMKKVKNLDNFSLITEYGNFIHKHNSFVVSNIEYVAANDINLPEIAYIHVGADLFLRKVYANLNANYRYSVLHNSTNKKRKSKKYTIVGPLCFAGDVLFENIELDEIHEGDKFIIYDIGSNTLSMWSGHCSREFPEFIFY